ncbi:MAG TPA: M3 family oligoendopeptidase [Ardenticatenaceae bacterium]|nr:M3 family oligoendopeptidase [Ardenticatenaceae bacterium]
MLSSLPGTSEELLGWGWAPIEAYYRALQTWPLSVGNVEEWLDAWTRVNDLLAEARARLYLATVRDTTDVEAERRYHAFLDTIVPPMEAADQALKEKLLASGLEPAGLEVALRNMRAESDLFRVANLPLMTEEHKLASRFNKIVGAQTVEWDGKELTLPQLGPYFQTHDRDTRERIWRLATQRQLADRQAIDTLWTEFMALRGQIAANAGRPDYRAYRWQQQLRFDYTPADAAHFQEAIAQVAVPAAARIYERHRRRLDVPALRPWDVIEDRYPLRLPALRPFGAGSELERVGARIFECVDPQLGEYFEIMCREGLLDLENRKGKGPGAFCTAFDAIRRPFIFMNAVGSHDDVQTLLHEAGHAFHVFETAHLPYFQHAQIGMEFLEVASMAMELLAMPYLAASNGGFYSDAEAARAHVEHLEHIILFWPYMAVVDAFQHWVYENHAAATNPANCDAKWAELWQRFMPGVDWSGLEAEMMTGWHRKRHIHRSPFYYIEYGLAQLGAVQVWRNAREDQAGAVARYRHALSLGGTVPLPELYAAAGARFAFDAGTLQSAVTLVEETIAELEDGL